MPQRITPPPDASINVQRAIQDLDRNDQETNTALEKAALKVNVDQQIADLQSQIDILKRGGGLDHNDMFRGGDSHSFGYVPDPGPTTNSGNVLGEDGKWGPPLDGTVVVSKRPPRDIRTDPNAPVVNEYQQAGGVSIAQRALNVHGSVAILGAASAHRMETREGVIGSVFHPTNPPVRTGILETDPRGNGNWTTSPLIQTILPGKAGTAINSTPMMNVIGSMGLTGALSADTLIARNLKVRYPGCNLFNSTSFTNLPSGNSELTWDSETYDTHGYHSTITNPGRITIPTGMGGMYMFFSSVYWDSSLSGDYNGSYLYINASNCRFLSFGPPGNIIIQVNCVVVPGCNDGDYFRIIVAHNRTGNATIYSTEQGSLFGCVRLGD